MAKLYKTIIFLLMILVLFSCTGKNALEATKILSLTIPQDAQLIVSNVRARGFTLNWENPDNKKEYEYAVAASYEGGVDTYEEALENNHIVLDFTSGKILNGYYKVKGLLAGKEYKIKLYIRGTDTKSLNYLDAKATLPYIDDAEITSLDVYGMETVYDKKTDTFSAYYFPGTKLPELKFTYKLMNSCELYINGELSEGGEIPFGADEVVELTVVNTRTLAARDYELQVKPIDNGIPVVIIETEDNRRITSTSKTVIATMRIIDNNPNNPLGVGNYNGEIEIKGRGNSSFGMPKKGYTINLPEKAQILDMAKSRDWLMMANYADKTLMRNYIAYEMYRDMGAPFSPKMRFADFILNGEYLGTYTIGERVKIDKGRLELDKIQAENNTAYDIITGGYILEVNSTDKYDKGEIIFETKQINWRKEHFFSIKQPGEKNISDEAYEYIKNYVNEAEDVLYGDNFKDPKDGFRKYIDTASVIDWFIVNEVFKQVDANFHTSVYMYKPRGGKLHMGPVWDFDLGGGNADYSGCDNPEGWYVKNAVWISRMFEDEEFVREFKKRWNELKNTLFERTYKRIDETAAILDKSQQLNFTKWPILGVYVWPNAPGVSERTTYQSEVDFFKNWLKLRVEWMDKTINNEM